MKQRKRKTTRRTKDASVGLADIGRPRDPKTGQFLPAAKPGRTKKKR